MYKLKRMVRAVQWDNAAPLALEIGALIYLIGQMVRGYLNGTFP